MTLQHIYTTLDNFITAHPIWSAVIFFWIAIIALGIYCYKYHREEIVMDFEEHE